MPRSRYLTSWLLTPVIELITRTRPPTAVTGDKIPYPVNLTSKMSDEEDPLVTKPFKFVTGKSPYNRLDALLLMLPAAGMLLPFSSTSSKSSLCFT